MSEFINKILIESGIFLTEGRMLGIVYHFTNFEGIFYILNDNLLLSHPVYKNKEKKEFLYGVSTTRTKFFKENNLVKTSIRIDLDIEKITNSYKVIPYQTFKDAGEQEELIITGKNGLINIKSYINKIFIYLSKEKDNFWAEKIDLIVQKIKESNIQFEIKK